MMTHLDNKHHTMAHVADVLFSKLLSGNRTAVYPVTLKRGNINSGQTLIHFFIWFSWQKYRIDTILADSGETCLMERADIWKRVRAK